MKTTYIDSNGNLVTPSSNSSSKNTYTYIDDNGNLASAEVPVAPVSKKKKKKNNWINLGAFDDGYDFGDVTKTILGTSADVGTSFLKGVSDVGAGAGKLAVGGIAQGADWLGYDEYANKLRKSLAGQNKKANEFLENYTPSGLFEKANKKLDKYSASGEKLDKINESIGQIAGYGAASSIAPILGTSAMFGSAAGENLSEAYSKEGVTDKQAWAKAIGSGAIEVATERLFGLFGKKGGLDTAIANKISGRLSNGISKILARQGIQATAEGTEEVISYAANQLLDMGIDKLSGKDAAKFYEKWNWEQVGEEFASAAIASGIVGTGQTALNVKNIKKEKEINTNQAINEYAKQQDVSEKVLTKNEQKVVDKEVQNRIKEQTADGKELTKKEKNKIEEQVKIDLEKGRISIDTIEEVLGDNSYKQYKNIQEQKNNIQEKINEYKKMKDNDITVEQREEYNKLKEELSNINEKSYKEQLSQYVENLTKNDYLLRTSYNEKANKSVAFDADLSKYNDKQKAVVQKAIDSGVLNNTNRSHELVDLVAKLAEDKGMDFDFVNNEKLKDTGFALEGKQVNGYNTGSSIGINIDSNKALNSIIGHEITHVLEGTDLYNELQNSIMEYAKTKGEYDTRLKELQELYKDVKDANVDNELTSDLVGDYLFTDEDFVNRLYNNNRNIFQKIYDEIKYFIKQIAPGSKEAKQLEQVKHAFEKAYNQNITNQSSDTKYSVISTKGAENLSAIDNRIMTRLEDAKKMQGKYTNEEIRQKTGIDDSAGWFKDPNGKWNFEISDRKADFKNVKPELNKKMNVEEIFEHPVLFEAYPELKNTKVKIKNIKPGKNGDIVAGYYDTFTKSVVLNNKFLKNNLKNSEVLRNVLLHEMQHKIQEIEGLEKGNTGKNEIRYYTSLGEIQSRDVENRSRYTYKQIREIAPETSKEYPIHSLLKEIYENPNSNKSKKLLQDKAIAELYNEIYNNGIEGEYERDKINKKGTTKYLGQDTIREKISHGIERWLDNLRNNQSVQKEVENTSFSNERNYRGSHQIENSKAITELNLDDVRNKVEEIDGYLTNQSESDLRKLKKILNNSNEKVTIYRASPVNELNSGDWVTTDKSYAKNVADNNGGKVYSYEVNANELYYPDNIKELPSLHRLSSFQYNENVNYSNVDNKGRELTKQQQEYFKDSKVRDENGNLLEVYHGTNADFNTYNNIKTEPGYWFTENKEYASEHGKNIKSQYLKLTNPITDIDLMWSLAEEKFGKNVTEKQMLSNDFKQFLIEKGYDGMVWDHSGANTYIAFYPNQIKNIDNTNPTTNDDIRYSVSEKGKQIAPVGNYQIKGKDVKLEKIAPVKETKTEVKPKAEKKTAPIPIMKKEVKNKLTKAEIEELNNLNIAEEVFDLSKEEQKRKDYLEKKQQGYIERYPGLKKISDFKDIAKEYREYKESTDFDNKLLKEAESLVPGYRDTGRRTKSEWLDIAEYIGNNFKDSSSKNLTKYAIQSWFEAQPNRKDTLNRQGNKFVDFKIQDWINAVYDGAKIGELEKPNIPINENIKPNKNVLLAENKSDNVLKVTAKGIAKQINETGDFNLKQRKWTETSTESDPLKGKVFIEDLDPSKITYEVQSNKKSLDTANKHLDTYGYDKSLEYVKNLIQGEGLPKASDVALMQRMIQEASKRGDAETVQNLIMDTAILGTDLGQATQALSIIQKLTPEGQLKMYTKLVNRAKARGEKSFQNVEITPEMVEKILNAYNEDGTYDQNDLNARVEEFKQDLANQMKSTVGEKIDAWRYLSMLGNPKTHIRNMVSNIAMTGTVKVKNAMARTLETILPVKDRTKTWKKASQEIKDYAAKTTQEMKGIITGESKYNEKSAIESKKEIFKNKTLEKISNFNSAALEGEDWFFSSRAFKSTFQEYLTANGINTMEDIKNNPELVEKAKNYAVEQAEIATFRQYSKLASMINQFERKGKVGKIAAEALMPFKKTPINVAKAGVNYSPLGLIKNITYDAYQLKQGNINASQFIDNISQGMTGTSLTLLGYALAKAGILSGSGSDDKEGKYDKQLGKSGYSVNLGGKSYSISWLSPVAMPLLVGTNAYEQLEEQKDWDMNVVSDTLAKTLDPLNEMSFMQGLTNALQSYGGGADKIKGSLESALQNYVGQFFPTLFSQIASVTDDKKRSTRPSNNSKYKFGEQTARSIMYKIPGLRQQLEPVTDIWGNEKLQSTDILERAFETFLAPYSKTEDITTDLDKELKRVYNEVGETKVIPGIPSSYVKYQNETYRMSAKEYTQYKKTYGQTANETLNDLINSESYQNASEEDKTKMIENVYDYAKAEANKEYFDNNNVEYTNKTLTKLDKLNEEFGINPNEYFENKNEYDYAYKNPEKYKTIKQITSYNNYNTYKNKIKEIKDNTTNDKQETIKYINSLKLSVPQKAMFIKQYYKSFTDYDNEIINYINSKKISSKDKTAILEQLGFTVRNGRVYTK